MSALQQIIGDMEGAITIGSVTRKAEISNRVTDLFVSKAAQFSDEELTLFDELLTRLAVQIEVSARAIMAVRLAPIPNAPSKVVRVLAFDDAIEVASPILGLSERLNEQDLIDNARRKSQGHLLAISKRKQLPESVTNVLVERGNRDVLMSAIGNDGARFSDSGFSILVSRADDDEELTINVGKRVEIPRYLFRQLLEKASRRVQVQLTTMHPELFVPIRDIVAEVSRTIKIDTNERSKWRETITTSPAPEQERIGPSSLQKLADAGDPEGVVSALAVMCNVSREFVEQAIAQRGTEILLILARVAQLSGPTLKSVLRLVRKGSDVESALTAYKRLNVKTAQEILLFYRCKAKPNCTA
jgi:hypothetical protein